MELARRLSLITEPQTIRMAKLSRELKAQGTNIIDLSLGEPDFRTPEHIIEAATQAMRDGYTKYPPVAGIPELRQAICEKLRRDNGLRYQPDEVIVSTGAKQSLANAVLSLVNPGDEVLIPTPYWVTYSALVQLAEGIVRLMPSSIETDYKLTPDQLDAAITPNTKLFIFSSPCNPSGSVYTRHELAQLAAVFAHHPQVMILSDEIYEHINFIGSHESIAQFPEIKDRVVVVNGFSKGFAMTGWRLGYMAGPKTLVQACEKLQAQITSGANIITQRAAIAALTGDMAPTRLMQEAFRQRRDFVVKSLGKIPGVRINQPQGAFYAFPDISHFIGMTDGATEIRNDEDMAMYLLHKGHVSTVCGSAFGSEGCIRISFATSMELLEAAMQRIADALSRLTRK